MTEVTIPIEMLARLPPRLLRRIAEAGERREREPEPPLDLNDCVKALFRQQKLPPAPPPNLRDQANWRRAFVAAVEECYDRRRMGQYRAVTKGVPGALVPVTAKGTARVRFKP